MNSSASPTRKKNNTRPDNKCMKCGKTLAKPAELFGIEIKCLRCGTLNRIFEKMIDQVIITDGDGVILFVNKAVEVATGYSSHEAIGKKPSELWGGNMSKEFYRDMWAKMLKDKKPTKIEMTNKRKTGEMYNVELLVSPISDTNGKILFFIGIEIVS